jgi:hypothetical protein
MRPDPSRRGLAAELATHCLLYRTNVVDLADARGVCGDLTRSGTRSNKGHQ